MTETLGGVSRSHTYGYDALSRLLSVDSGGAVEAWTYDAFGNRVTHTPPAGPVAHYVHDDAHQLLEIREGSPAGPLVGQLLYDANGNLTKHCTGNVTDLGGDCTGDDALTLAYDALDRQVQASRTGLPAESYTYDPQGRRIAKTVGATTTAYHYDGDALYQQVEGDWSDPVARYVHGAGIDTPILHYAPARPSSTTRTGTTRSSPPRMPPPAPWSPRKATAPGAIPNRPSPADPPSPPTATPDASPTPPASSTTGCGTTTRPSAGSPSPIPWALSTASTATPMRSTAPSTSLTQRGRSEKGASRRPSPRAGLSTGRPRWTRHPASPSASVPRPSMYCPSSAA
nr:RHS repeat domain-containing protein [Halochromatium glycolicum]